MPAILDIVECHGPFEQQDWELHPCSFRGKSKDPRNPNVDMKLSQHLNLFTPYGLSVESTSTYRFSSSYLTREFSPEAIQSILANHANYKEDRDTAPAEKLKRRIAFCQFMALSWLLF